MSVSQNKFYACVYVKNGISSEVLSLIFLRVSISRCIRIFETLVTMDFTQSSFAHLFKTALLLCVGGEGGQIVLPSIATTDLGSGSTSCQAKGVI